MNRQARKWMRRWQRRSAHSLVEYAIILFFVAMVAVLMLRGIGSTTNNSITPVDNALQ